MTRLRKNSNQYTLHNNDVDMHIEDIIVKHQRKFAKHFLPRHCIGVIKAWGGYTSDDHVDADFMIVISRNKIAHLRKGRRHEISMDEIKIWCNNIALYNFIGDKQ